MKTLFRFWSLIYIVHQEVAANCFSKLPPCALYLAVGDLGPLFATNFLAPKTFVKSKSLITMNIDYKNKNIIFY